MPKQVGWSLPRARRRPRHGPSSAPYAVPTAYTIQPVSPSTPSPDVVVVGAGIVGAACAYFLSRAGARVRLVERGFPASGASGACEGNLLLWDKQVGPELEPGKLAFSVWDELVA